MLPFFSALWPNVVPGHVTFWFAPSKASHHVELSKLLVATEEDVEELEGANEDGQNVFFGLGLRKADLGIERQGGWKDIVALPGLALDIDIAQEGAHKAANLPASIEEAAKILEGQPDPTWVNSSGYGLHCYWLFENALILHSEAERAEANRVYERFQAPFIARGASLGWQVDKTSTINRVWRVPGMRNWKKDGAKTVSVLFQGGLRYPAFPVANSSQVSVVPVVPPPPVATQGDLRVALVELANRSQHAIMLKNLLAGRSIAEAGQRDESLQRLCSTIAFFPPARTLPIEQIVEIFRPSLSVWAAEPGAKSLNEELSKVADKLVRARRDCLEKEEAKRLALQALAGVLRRGKEPALEDDSLTANDLAKCAIIQFQGGYHVFDFRTGAYFSRLLIKQEIENFIKDAWVNAPDPISLTYTERKKDKKGSDEYEEKVVRKKQKQIEEEYASVAEAIEGDLSAQRSYYDLDERVFYDATCPLRPLTPQFDPNVDQWLRLLGTKNADKLLDWVATVTDLSKACSALYLEGPTGAGKDLLSKGLAKLWSQTGAPTNLISILSEFNATVLQCPLIYLGEGLPDRHANYTVQIRDLISSTNREVNQKNVPKRTIRGCIRLMIGANNPDVLAFGDEQLSTQDLEAVVSRFLHVNAKLDSCPKCIAPSSELPHVGCAVAYLREHNPGDVMTAQWVAGDVMARHALWLRDNRTVAPGKRFLVEGVRDELHRRMVMRSGPGELVLEWMVRYLQRPQALEHVYAANAKKVPKIVAGGGKLYVNSSDIYEHWNVYHAADRPRPSITKIGMTLARFACGKLRPRAAVDGSGVGIERPRFTRIVGDMIFQWAEETDSADPDQLKRTLDRPLPDWLENADAA